MVREDTNQGFSPSNPQDESGEVLSLYRFVFVGGLHKSGTSVLHNCIREHAQVSGFRKTGVPKDEGQHLQDVYPKDKPYDKTGYFGKPLDLIPDENSTLITKDNRRKLFGQWAKNWNLTKECLVEKTPANLLYASFLQRMFPRSHFVFIIRHPAAQVLAVRKWYKLPVVDLIDHWLRCHLLFLARLPGIQQYRIIKYERFVKRPLAHLEQIYSFLELQPYAPSEKVKPRKNESYFQLWIGLCQQLEDEEKQRLSVLEEKVAAFGYSLTDPALDVNGEINYLNIKPQ